jgi:hypothetical protein
VIIHLAAKNSPPLFAPKSFVWRHSFAATSVDDESSDANI